MKKALPLHIESIRKIMNYSIKDFEIMAPVGSRESLAAALHAGADSIYFGIEPARLLLMICVRSQRCVMNMG